MVSVDTPVKPCMLEDNNSGHSSLSKTHLRRLARNTAAAYESKCHQRHAATIIKGGSMLSRAVNTMKNSPRDFDNMDYDRRGPSKISTHAEIAAMRRCAPEKLKGATIYVSRMANCGVPLLSKPCPDCHAALVAAGVRRVVYTDRGGAQTYVIN